MLPMFEFSLEFSGATWTFPACCKVKQPWMHSSERTSWRWLPERIVQLDYMWVAEPSEDANLTKHNPSIL